MIQGGTDEGARTVRSSINRSFSLLFFASTSMLKIGPRLILNRDSRSLRNRVIAGRTYASVTIDIPLLFL